MEHVNSQPVTGEGANEAEPHPLSLHPLARKAKWVGPDDWETVREFNEEFAFLSAGFGWRTEGAGTGDGGGKGVDSADLTEEEAGVCKTGREGESSKRKRDGESSDGEGGHKGAGKELEGGHKGKGRIKEREGETPNIKQGEGGQLGSQRDTSNSSKTDDGVGSDNEDSHSSDTPAKTPAKTIFHTWRVSSLREALLVTEIEARFTVIL
jgi:hypothetical protein